MATPKVTVSLGIRSNLQQFILLVIINAFVGSLVGFYSLIPLIGEKDFGITSNVIILSYVVAFGLTKAVCNYYAGKLADKFGRKRILVLGLVFGMPVPILVIVAPSWSWIVLANVLLGVTQGLAWSMTVIMKIDLSGPARRGLATGLNEFAGYLAISMTLLGAGYVASRYGLRPEPFYLGIVTALIGLSLSVISVRETRDHAQLETQQLGPNNSYAGGVDQRSIFLFTSFKDRALSSSCFAGLVNNLIFGMSWGLFPLFFASHGLDVGTINFIKSFYPGVWGVLQLVTGPLSDRMGRKWLIVSGQVIQAIGIWVTIFSKDLAGWILGSGLIGFGTALVYPTLLASVSDVAHPSWRGASLGTYRFWRDTGYAVGAIVTGLLADMFDIPFAINLVGWLTLASALLVAFRMYETLPARKYGYHSLCS